jgi:hypothetical protein
MTTPSITAAQAITIVSTVLGLAASFGLNLTEIQQGSILALVGVLGSVLLHSDAKIRNGRAQIVKAQVEAEALSVNIGPTVTGPPVHGLDAPPPGIAA